MGANGLEPIVNPIYKFICEDVLEDPVTHEVKKIIGRHKRVGKLSEQSAQRMLKAGIKKSRFEFLMKPVEAYEEEVYETDEYGFYH